MIHGHQENDEPMVEFGERPPWVPDRETVVTDEPSFVEVCKAALSAPAQELQWEFEKSLLTRNQRWGLVWRADFVVAGQQRSSRLINRAMCWGGANGVEGTAVGFGQRIAPLE
jgi:hypothetical protein